MKAILQLLLAPVLYLAALIVLLSIIIIPLSAIGLGFGALAGCAALAFRWVSGV